MITIFTDDGVKSDVLKKKLDQRQLKYNIASPTIAKAYGISEFPMLIINDSKHISYECGEVPEESIRGDFYNFERAIKLLESYEFLKYFNI